MNKKLLVIAGLLTLLSTAVYAQNVRLASPDGLRLLKTDLLEGKIKVGQTRLTQIREVYGDAANITDSDNRLIYDYGDLKITFDKKKYLRNTEYDYSQKLEYADNIEDLRSDLSSGQIVGDYVSFDSIRKTYGEPTKAFGTDGDGDLSVYFYSEIKLTFENVVVVQNWRGNGLDKGTPQSGEVLGSKPNQAPIQPKVEVKKDSVDPKAEPKEETPSPK